MHDVRAQKMNASTGMVRLRQAVGTFHDAAPLHNVAQVLTDRGVEPADLTVLVGHETLDTKLLPHVSANPGTVLDKALTSMSVIGATQGAGPLLVSSGAFGDRLVAAATDKAQSSEPFLARWLPPRHAAYLHEQLDAGAALLWAHVRNGEEEKRAGTALLKHSQHQVQMHDFSFPDPSSPTTTPSS